MGKKSRKRTSGGGGGGGGARPSTARVNPLLQEPEEGRRLPPNLRTNEEEETAENLRFEDPYLDEFEEEEEDGIQEESMNFVPDEETDGSNHLMEEETMAQQQQQGGVQAWNPLTAAPLEGGERLEMDESAYNLFFALQPEWPSLSIDILKDSWGNARSKFPHSLVCAVGTQADRRDRNKLTLMKLSDLSRTSSSKATTEEELDNLHLGDEFNNDDNNKDDDDDDDKDESSDEEEEDLDPVLEHYSMRHDGGVNRIRSMPQNPNIIATWSDVGMVNLYDTQGILDLFNGTSSNNNKRGSSSFRKDPFFVYSGHATEGFAMDWSNTKEGNLATGDCQGNIHVWNVADAISTTSSWNQSSFGVQSYYAPSSNVEESPSSVEDIQWSPTEATVLATAQDDGCVKIYDTRAPNRFMISQLVGGSSSNTTNNGVDVNVLSWNAQVANLLATGSDDGGLAVWDLRQFSASIPKPLARFTCHSTPITSVEWHPTDESMLLVTDENATYIYDLSIEEDDVPMKTNAVENNNPNVDDIPPQLLFVHCGSNSTKEAHWHPQITSLVMTTALSGFNVFIPSNL